MAHTQDFAPNHLVYRDARPDEKNIIANLVILTDGGIFEFLLHDLIPNVTSKQIVIKLVGETDNVFSYKNWIVAEMNGKIFGAALSYSVDLLHSPEQEKFIPRERINHIREFYLKKVPNSWYLHALATIPEARNKGIGSQLIAHMKDLAREHGYNKLSLHVWADNFAAISLYKNLGFKIADTIKIEPHHFLPHQNGMLLMYCDC
jgi:ribosomal protein S18 acetylase RimI-like enzyme